MPRAIEACVRWFLRRFMPGIAAALEEENQFGRIDGPESDSVDPSLYLQVENNGSDTTIVAFAGMAVLYAAMPKFEFKKMLEETGRYNFVFVRDVYRTSYRRAPDASGDGIAFYERAVADALLRIGAQRNIAIGMSGGGEAAFRISGASPIHQVVAFNPSFPLARYSSLNNLMRVLLNCRTLVREPAVYLEVLLVTLGARYLHKRNCRLLGDEDLERPLGDYLRRAAPAVLIYSTRFHPDSTQALALKDVPSITLVPVESARHNCLVDLKKQGKVTEFLREVLSGSASANLKTD